MSETLKPDICVIGAGSGGLTTAAFAAVLGAPVVLIEKHEMGGDCLNTGCVPSKALIAAGRRAKAIRTAPAFGVSAGEPKVDFAGVHAHIHDVIATIQPNDSVERFTALGVNVIKGEATFVGPRTVKVGDTTIEARRFVIATGSRAMVPPIPGLDTVPYLTNETVFDLKICPRHILVMGGGPIGLELAQSFARLGAEVTVLERARLSPKDDPEMVAIVRRSLEADGVKIFEGAEVVRVEAIPDGVRVHARRDGVEDALEVSHLLVAAGRRPNIESLGLDAAGVAYTPRGVTVDRGLRTSNRRIYAIGDVAGGYQFTHVAGWHGSLVAQSILFRRPVRTDRTPIPWCTYTDPELSHVGLTEAEATKVHGKIRILRWPFHENDRAVATRETEGHVKLITTAKGKIVGCSIVGPEAGDLIAPYVIAVAKGMTVSDLTGIVMPYPTFSEAGKRAAGTYFQSSLTNPWVGRIIRFLRRLG
jgi:pyruvate/2-oxoglutarate dehydrogenase complex dihydrolipoamide dehydrogenase (E3) component